MKEDQATKSAKLCASPKSVKYPASTTIQHLFESIEAGLLDPKIKELKKRLGGHQARRAALDEEIALLERQCGDKHDQVDAGTIAAFAAGFKKKLTDPKIPRCARATCKRS